MKTFFVWFILLTQLLALSPADNQRAEVAHGQQHGQPVREAGADLVDSAMVELRKIHHPAHHRRRKVSGIFGTALSYAMKVIPTFTVSAPPSEKQHRAVSGPLLEAVKLLEQSSQQNNSDALYMLAEMNFWGNYSHPRDFRTAFRHYKTLADSAGNGSAMHMLGMMYSTGIGGVVPRDQARALLYYVFAASRGHTRSEMTVASRHHSGIGTPKNCEAAVKYYKRVADKAMDWYRSGPPGGMAWTQEAYRIADESGGVYGEGASAISSGLNAIRASPHSDAYASIDDVIEYLDLMSQRGDFKSTFNLGRIYYEGQRGLDRNLPLARKYFMSIVGKYWKKGRTVDNHKPGLEKMASRAAGYLGRMYLRGDGVDQNFETARRWFEHGIQHGDAQSQFGLGIMLLYGHGMEKSLQRATELLKASADQDYAHAQVELGTLYLDQGGVEDIKFANNYFELAARYQHIEALYYLAELTHLGIGRDRACGLAQAYYKLVAEKAEPIHSPWLEANQAYEDGDHELAFLSYLVAAEQGYERAQNNVAYMLDAEQSKLPIPRWVLRQAPKPALLENPSLALIYWTRSSRQNNIDSMVKMGDYYLAGVGAEADVDKAVQCYTGASEYYQSAQALYNLGWMHENGIGMTQDFHLAKRYYDSALETNEEAYLPVTLSLLKLRVRSAWNTFTHGRINSIRDEPTPRKDWSLSEWIANFLQDDQYYYDDMNFDEMYDDPMPGGDSGITGDMDEGLMESLIIIGLAAALVFLVYYRQQRQLAQRQAEENARRQGQAVGQGGAPQAGPLPQDRGVFPQPGDADFAGWVAGGVGH